MKVGARVAWLIVLAVGLFVIPVTARAGGDPEVTFAAGRQLYDAGNFANALPLFTDAYAQTKSPNARLYVARCLRELGRRAEAYDELSGTVRDATAKATTDPTYAPTRDSAAAELALLDPLIGKVVIAIADAPPVVEVSLNDHALDPSKIGTVVAVEPGKVHVVVRAPEKDELVRDTDVAAGQTVTITLVLQQTKAVVTTPVAPSPSGRPFGAVRAAGIAVGIVGLAGIATAIGTGVKAKSEFDDLDVECSDTKCPASDASRISDGRTLSTVANVTAVIGGAAVAAGTLMIIFGGGKSADAPAKASAAVGVSPSFGGAVAQARVRF